MFKKVFGLLLVAGLSSGAVMAETDQTGAVILPLTESSYQPHFTLSAIGGVLTPDDGDIDSGSVTGVELSLDCPLFQPPMGVIRQQVSYTTYSKNDLTVSSFELNPHFLVEITKDLLVGGGPGFGFVTTDPEKGDSENYLAFQMGLNVQYKAGPLLLGSEFRKQWTQKKDDSDFNNNRLLVKVGYNF